MKLKYLAPAQETGIQNWSLLHEREWSGASKTHSQALQAKGPVQELQEVQRPLELKSFEVQGMLN